MSQGPSYLRRWMVGVCLLACAAPASAAPSSQDTVPLRELSLEQLGEIVVTSVSKLEDELWRTSAAVSVITADDIRRSGAASLPEVLRLATGVEVARADSSHYSIGIRGFGEQFSKSLLVLVDGRNLYNQLFAGTYWPAHDVMLEDVERIEVIRGPGGTIWGGNAVNGVINVITRRAAETRGALVSVGAGTVDHGTAAVRYGGASRGLDYRVYAKAFLRGPQMHPDGSDFDDDWWLSQAGFRIDRASTGRGSLTLAGAVNTGGHGQRVPIATFTPPAASLVDDPVDTSGGHLLARWDGRLNQTDIQIQSYYDRTVWRAPHFAETRDTADVDYLHSGRLATRHQLSWGGGLRWSAGAFTQTIQTLDFTPRDHTDWLVSGFANDEIHILPDRLSISAGTKIEHNSYTGVEWQPSARLLWRPRSTQTVWVAATRAVRTPSRIERSIQAASLVMVNPFPAYFEVRGSDGFESERTVSYAAGYRALAGSPLFVDLAVFVNQHRDLTGFSRLAPVVVTSPGPVRAIVPLLHINAIDGSSAGFELAPEWRAAANVRLSGSYAFRRMALEARPENMDPQAVPRYEGSSPSHLARIQARIDLPRHIELDAAYRYVSALPFRSVEAYHTADLRLGWRPSATLELAVAGHNLLQPHHAEYGQAPGPHVGIRRSASVQVIWHTASR